MEEVTTVVSPCGIFQYTFKTEFLKNGVDPSKLTFFELVQKHELGRYLHNPYGPAVVSRKQGYGEYWLDGKKVSDEVAEKIKHNAKFNNTLEDLLSKPE
jgi:hypothetical protein